MITEEKCNAQTWLVFLKSHLEKYGKSLIIIDGAPYHFERDYVQKFYEENIHQLKVMQLPPYSPQLNPIEQTWKKVKKHLAMTTWKTEEEFEEKLKQALQKPNLATKMYEYYFP